MVLQLAASSASLGGQAARPVAVVTLASSRTYATTRSTKTTKRKPAKKPAPKKKKKAVVKKKAAPKKRRVVSPAAKALIERRELRAKALFDEPAQLPATPWLVYVSENTKGTKVGSSDQFASRIKQLSSSFKSLSTFESQVG